MTIPDTDLLNNILRYEPETGKLFWKRRDADTFQNGKRSAVTLAKMWNKKYAGKEAFTSNHGAGHRQGIICGRKVFAHRVIWEMVTGEKPNVIDHINGNPSDNRWINIRNVSQHENMKNTKKRSDNTSSVTGVSRYRTVKWIAYINIDKKRVQLGCFSFFEDAVEARKRAEQSSGYHVNHGLPKAPTSCDNR